MRSRYNTLGTPKGTEMAIPSIRWLRRIGITVAAVAFLWAVWWLWSRLAPQWEPLMLIAIAIVATPLLVAVWWLWWQLPGWQVTRLSLKIRDPKARADVEDNFRKTVGQALGGAAVLIGAMAAYLQFTQQQQASHDVLISNQVSKSFEQLGSQEMATRLGGIYGLEGVMNTSEQYHQPVLEALCAFVRESTTHRQGTLAAWLKAKEITTDKVNDAPATDVQAALTVIGRRYPGPGRVNLTGANIQRASLLDAQLEDATLSRAHLDDARLERAHLKGAHLEGAHLEGASLKGAHLEHAVLSGAHLEHAFLPNADLEDTDLTAAHLDGAILVGVHLEGAGLVAYLEGANLIRAHLERAHLEGANLKDADLTAAHLDGAFLSGALGGAHLEGAHLDDADLAGAKGLTQAQIDAAYGNAVTKLPNALTRPARWTAPEGAATPTKP